MSAPKKTWQKSSYSGSGDGNNCVELAALPGAVALRESEEPGAVLSAAPRALDTLLRSLKAGQFDSSSRG